MEKRDIPGYEGLYAATKDGQIWSYKRNKFMKASLNSSGYLKVNLTKDGIPYTHYVHRLVAETFIPNPDNLPQINHLDENKLNNELSNLTWCTARENLNYGTRLQKISKRIRCVETGEEFNSIKEAAEAINMTPAAVSIALRTGNHCKDCHWEYIEEESA